MGFEISRQFTLDFTDTDWEGAIVTMRGAPISIVLEMSTCDLQREAELLAQHLVSWNLEMNGEPVPLPATAEEVFARLEAPAKNLIIVEWMRASRGISAPLDRRSNGGESSPEVENVELSIPMETS